MPYKWEREPLRGEGPAMPEGDAKRPAQPRKRPAAAPADIGAPEAEEAGLERGIGEPEPRRGIMGGAIGILGKGRGADPQDELADRERTALVDEPRPGRRPSGPLPAPGMARSGHRCRQGALHAPDGDEGARGRIREASDASDGVCGRRRVHDGPEGGGTTMAGHGTVRIMGEGGLVARGTARPRRGHSSHRGELSEHPGDKVCRDFASGLPDFPWPAGATRPPMPAGKPCLGPVLGCLDGSIVSRTTPTC